MPPRRLVLSPRGGCTPTGGDQRVSRGNRKYPINTARIKTSVLASTLLWLPLLGHAQTISEADYRAGRLRLGKHYGVNRAACFSLASTAQIDCLERARGRERVALAELLYSFSGRAADRRAIAMQRANAAFEIAREHCVAPAGAVHTQCISVAEAARAQAVAAAGVGASVAHAAAGAAAVAQGPGDGKVAGEKCDTLAASTRMNCATVVKANYLKN
ncbi:MAG: hypothetical protein KGQ77_09175 [Betaproteobacteria bacterium]|nr:hypothetical protein [Betaproteobacteria bacterium]